MRNAVIFFLFATIFFPARSQQPTGYRINVSIRGLQDSAIYLAYYYGDKQYLKDTATLDKSGRAIIEGKTELPQGIYMVVLPRKQYFEVLISEDQHFSVDCSYADYSSTLRFTGSDENSAFVDYQKKWMALQMRASAIDKRMQINKENSDSLKILSTIRKSHEEAMKAYLRTVAAANKQNLLGTLVKSLIPVEIPEFVIPYGVKNPDSLRWVYNYNYNKDHFFDNLDLRDERLLRTPIFHARLDAFFTNVVIQAPDSINREIDKIMKKVNGNYKMFQYVAVYLFNHFRQSQYMGHDAIMVKLADDIYLSGKADWTTKEFRDDLKKQVDLIRPNLIGKRAQNLIMDSYNGTYVSLDDVEKDFTVLYFWEPDCGHCKEATPKLKAFYDKPRNYSMEVFAVCTTSEKEKWEKYIGDNHLTWINGWDPKRSSHFDYFYNVQSTPLVYILDRNKKIIAKKLSVEEIGSFIDSYRKFHH